MSGSAITPADGSPSRPGVTRIGIASNGFDMEEHDGQ
jgi:hypothetical protein